jgi:Zn-dependent protease with chaperone function/DNA-directed RNA polymerase subunit RPC12/RpoP
VSIHVICSHCQAELEVSDAAAGKKGRCPACQAVMEIPRAAGNGSPMASGDGDTILVHCSECGMQLQVSAASAGRKGRCPRCQAVMPIPAAAGATRAPAEKSGKTAAPSVKTDEPRPMVSSTRYVRTENERPKVREKRVEEIKPVKIVDEDSLLLLPPGESPATRPDAEPAPVPAPPLIERKKPAAAGPPSKPVPPQLIKPPVQNPALPPQPSAPSFAAGKPPDTAPPKPPAPPPAKPPPTPPPQQPPATPPRKPPVATTPAVSGLTPIRPQAAANSPAAAAVAEKNRRPASPAAAAPAAAAVPSPAQPAPTVATAVPREQLAAQILGAFTGQIARTPPSLMYKLGILLTTAVMLILPLVYVGLIVLASGVVLWHLTSNVGLVTAISGRGAILGLIAYLAPAAMGSVLILFMVKPLFAPSGEREKSRTLTRESEPLVFAFVERICTTVQAPVPTQIDVNCEVNASAGFRSGIASFAGHDLVLTIGMPLVAGLSLQQLGGVLAHEFGHFSQGTGMRLTYVTRTINHWLMRVVYERDSWDMWLDRITDSVDIRIGWVLYLTRFLVWLTRRVLWLLMLLGHAVSGFMLREMEYDADRYEARLAGSHTFEATVRQLIYLNLANRGAHADLENFYREGRLADNLPRLIIANVAQLPEEARKFADELIEKEETSVFDSHPSDRDRIASARQESAAGVFQSRQPGTILFHDFDGLAKAVTWDFYSEIFGSEFKPTAVRPIEELLERQSRRTRSTTR